MGDMGVKMHNYSKAVVLTRGPQDDNYENYLK